MKLLKSINHIRKWNWLNCLKVFVKFFTVVHNKDTSHILITVLPDEYTFLFSSCVCLVLSCLAVRQVRNSVWWIHFDMQICTFQRILSWNRILGLFIIDESLSTVCTLWILIFGFSFCDLERKKRKHNKCFVAGWQNFDIVSLSSLLQQTHEHFRFWNVVKTFGILFTLAK